MVHRFAAQCSCYRGTIYQRRQRFAKTALHPASNDEKGSRERTCGHHLREWLLSLYQMIGISWWRLNTRCNTWGSFAFRQPSCTAQMFLTAAWELLVIPRIVAKRTCRWHRVLKRVPPREKTAPPSTFRSHLTIHSPVVQHSRYQNNTILEGK